MDNSLSKKIYAAVLLIGVLIVVLVLMGAAYYFFTQAKSSQSSSALPVYNAKNTANDTLTKNNPSFAQAEVTLGSQATTSTSQENALASIPLYQQALADATDNIQRAQVAYKIARAEEKAGQYVNAINDFKSLAASTTVLKIVRAYSVQSMGDMFYTYNDPAIKEETFRDAPYSAMVVKGDTAQTYRHLFEYAVSLYPLGLSETRIADWYANDLLALYASSKNPSSTVVSKDLGRIAQSLALADKDLKRMESEKNAKFDAPEVLQRKAVVIGKLARIGKATPSDAEASFKTAQNMSSLLEGKPNGFTSYLYADFLANAYGKTRLTDIQAQLSNIYAVRSTSTDPVVLFLTNEKTNTLNVKQSLVNLAALDPKFKTYLTSLGWTTTDFASNS